MELGQILSSLRRNKAGAALIALQIAVTLAVLCNAFFIIRQQMALSRTPSGVRDEGDVFIIGNQWVGQSGDLAAREETDLRALRALPQVVDAVASADHPLGGGVVAEGISLHPQDPRSFKGAMVYMVDDHAIRTLGVRLIAGRNFRPGEIVVRNGISDHATSLDGVIVTQALARQLAPHGSVLGHTATILPQGTQAPVVGVISSLQSSPFFRGSPIAQSAMLLPNLWVSPQLYYLVRAKPGQLGTAMAAARKVLYKTSRQRIIGGMQSLTAVRRASYRSDRGVALIMGAIAAILLVVTAFGILGLTNYWVSQRTRQIGIRRALGATRSAILRYFQLENLLITIIGSILGVLLAVAANLWLLRNLALARLPASYVIVGAIAVLVLGQLAVLWPALRAAWVPPAVATRSV